MQNVQNQLLFSFLVEKYKPSAVQKCPNLYCKTHQEPSLFFKNIFLYDKFLKEFYCQKCLAEKKPDLNLLTPATKENIFEILLEIEKALNTKFKLF